MPCRLPGCATLPASLRVARATCIRLYYGAERLNINRFLTGYYYEARNMPAVRRSRGSG